MIVDVWLIGGLKANITVALTITDRLSQVHEALAKEAKSNPKAVVARFEEVRDTVSRLR